jgi:hypothetical protein
MPVTLKYGGTGYVRFAVFNSVEEAEAQAKHDIEVVGRQPVGIIDGDNPLVVNPKVLVDNNKLVQDLGATKKLKQYTDGRV